MKRVKILILAAIAVWMLSVPEERAVAGSVYASPYVRLSPDGKAWTVEQALPPCGESGWPAFWYRPGADDFRTGVASALRNPGVGQHFYQYDRGGVMPVGMWKVARPDAVCIQGEDVWKTGAFYHGIELGLSRCGGSYFSGWIACCADCGESLGNLIYMSREAARTITEIPMGVDYYYLCPHCRHLEQGVKNTHRCTAVSYNRYRVVYDGNAEDVRGSMADSLHMYGNAEIFEGKRVTPVRTLSLNSYRRTGYRFLGWNTSPDGRGVFYGDGQEIRDLTEENDDGYSGRGVVRLYAQWERLESFLVLDAAGGDYSGENPFRRAYGEEIDLSGVQVVPPKGYTVSFQSSGGGSVSPVTGTRTFERWEIAVPMHGSLTGNRYRFLGEADAVDTAVAVYSLNPIVLPAPEKENASFGGWYDDEGLTRLIGYGGDLYTPVGDVTLYAMWVELRLYSEENDSAENGRGAVDLRWEQPDLVDKIYRLYQSGDGGKNYRQISVVTASVEPEERLEAVFRPGEGTGGAQPHTIVVQSPGFYTLTAEGAQGGNYKGFTGGPGGKASGKFYLTKGETLTFSVGGQNGENGGGSGTAFANGGGMTRITSDRKGVLLTGGGGGGASEAGNGYAGGSGLKLVGEGSAGESGMAGGGGGYQGGAAGEYILHRHGESCSVRCDVDYIALDRVAVEKTNYADDDEVEYYQVRRTGLIETKGAGSVYVRFDWFNAWVEPVLSRTEVRILDQNGRVLAEQNAERVLDSPTFHNGASVHGLLQFCTRYGDFGSYEAFISQFSSYTFSGLTTYFSIYVEPTEEGESICVIEAEPVTDGTRNWVHVRLTDAETGRVYENENGHAYRAPDILTRTVLIRSTASSEGYDNWNGPYVERHMEMMLGCEIGEGVTGIYAEGVSVLDDTEDRGAHYRAELSSVVLREDRLVCGMKEGQVISSKPAYGGSSYVNRDFAVTWELAAGCAEGDGTAGIRAEMTGLSESQELKGVAAHDKAAPHAVDAGGVVKTPLDSRLVEVSFQPVEDVGSEYFFRAESYSVRTGERICTSNITKNTLKTGLAGYLYLIDREPFTVLTAESGTEAAGFLEEERLVARLEDFAQYLHLAAVDRAGNVSETTHVTLSRTDRDLFWQPYTDRIRPDSVVGGQDYGNLYPAGERTYYVRADGVTPFLLSFDSYIDGTAREDYQIDYQIFDIRVSDGVDEVSQRHISRLPHAAPPEDDLSMDGACFVRQTEGQVILKDAMYSGAERSAKSAEVSFYQAFTMESPLSGRRIRVVPAAGAGTPGGVLYSRRERDEENGLWLVADGEGPRIRGLDAFGSKELIDRTKEKILVEAEAEDGLSGVRDFYLQVENLDNFSRVTYPADENGVVRVEITKSDPLFSGDIRVTAYAVDNVGNETREDWYVTEFALEAEVERILDPHEPVFKCGESGVLSVVAWGYVDRVEVVFPDFLSEYSRVFDYGEYPGYREESRILFMIPLYAPEDSFEITVRAGKGDRQLEEHPVIRTIRVRESILDEIRTRLRE